MKTMNFFLSENVQFLKVKFSIYLNRSVLGNDNCQFITRCTTLSHKNKIMIRRLPILSRSYLWLST